MTGVFCGMYFLVGSSFPKAVLFERNHLILLCFVWYGLHPATRYFLFYWQAREQWQIHKRPASKSCARLKTTGAPHLEATWQVWKKKERSLRCAFQLEPEMTCSLPPPLSVEEQILGLISFSFKFSTTELLYISGFA